MQTPLSHKWQSDAVGVKLSQRSERKDDPLAINIETRMERVSPVGSGCHHIAATSGRAVHGFHDLSQGYAINNNDMHGSKVIYTICSCISYLALRVQSQNPQWTDSAAR